VWTVKRREKLLKLNFKRQSGGVVYMKKTKNCLSSTIFSLALIGIGTIICTAVSKRKRTFIKREDVKEEATYKYNFTDSDND
jgi:hypothetical protein